jgi:hypothetical protein
MGEMLINHIRDTCTFLKVFCAFENRTYDRNIFSPDSSFRGFSPLVWFHSPRYGSESRDVHTSQSRADGSSSQGTYSSRHLQNRDDLFQILRNSLGTEHCT